VQTWQRANDPDDVAQKLGISKETAIQLASLYRRKNVPLKKMRKGPSQQDWKSLADLAKRLNKAAHASLN
jgi:hypothetical protein